MASGLIGTDVTVSDSMTYPLQDAFQLTLAASSACFVTLGSALCAYTVAIRKFDEQHYWSFDSHSRSDKGTCATDGNAVIMEASSLTALVSYIRELANSISSNAHEMPF